MDPTMQWLMVAAVVLALIGVAWFILNKRRTQELRGRFGPEYDRTVRSTGDTRKAEAELAARTKRVQALQIHPLTPADATRFDRDWRTIQTQFVDDPRRAVSAADRLVGEVMMVRGYPVGDFEQRVADISVDHPNVVMNYRAARDISIRHARGEANTEDMRQAMVHNRALFAELLEMPPDAKSQPHEEPAVARRR